MKDRILGWGCAFMGLIILLPGLTQLASGTFLRTGRATLSRWDLFLNSVFGTWAPYVSGVLWLVAGGLFIVLGFSMILAKRTDNQE
jgi:hypothetical protein